MLALADIESTSVKEEAQSAKDALSRGWEQAVEDYKLSEDFKNEILEGGYTSYCISYKDGRDTVEKLYPDLDLSSITAPTPEEEKIAEGQPRLRKLPRLPEFTPIVEEAMPESVRVESATVEGHEIEAAAATDIAEEEINW